MKNKNVLRRDLFFIALLLSAMNVSANVLRIRSSCITRLPRLKCQKLSSSTASTSHDKKAKNVYSFNALVPDAVQKNLGMGVFLSVIGGVVVALYRTYKSNSNFNEIKDDLQGSSSVIDLAEQRELMHQNRTLTPVVFEDISRSLPAAFPSGRCTYLEFVSHVQGYLESPISHGHCLDRVVISQQDTEKQGGRDNSEDPRFLMTVLALALDSEPLEDRASLLFRMMRSADSGKKSVGATVRTEDIAASINYLHISNQTPVSKRVIKTDRVYPVQTYKEATAVELVAEALAELKLNSVTALKEDEFVEVLLSHAVCAWGSCYRKGPAA